LARNVAASLGIGTSKPYKHRNMGLVVDLGPLRGGQSAQRAPVGVPGQGRDARLPPVCDPAGGVNRWAVSLAYLTDAIFDRSVVSIGLSTEEDARFSASEGIAT
jgi:NADH:quinone reductase (non-electrogenic)